MSESWDNRPWPRAFFTAIQFLTRLPVPGGKMRDLSTYREDIARGMIFFPLLGAAISALTAAALYAFDAVLPFFAAVIAALAVEALITGAFHEDAVADFFDAFGGGWTREAVLRILKDSRVGSFGTLGLGLAVALRAAGLISFESAAAAIPALIISGSIGRLVILAAMMCIPPVPEREGLSKDIGQVADAATFVWGAALASPILIWFLWRDPVGLVAVTIALAVFVAWFRAYLLRRLGGITGDCLGFSAYVGIVVTTLVLARKI